MRIQSAGWPEEVEDESDSEEDWVSDHENERIDEGESDRIKEGLQFVILEDEVTQEEHHGVKDMEVQESEMESSSRGLEREVCPVNKRRNSGAEQRPFNFGNEKAPQVFSEALRETESHGY